MENNNTTGLNDNQKAVMELNSETTGKRAGTLSQNDGTTGKRAGTLSQNDGTIHFSKYKEKFEIIIDKIDVLKRVLDAPIHDSSRDNKKLKKAVLLKLTKLVEEL